MQTFREALESVDPDAKYCWIPDEGRAMVYLPLDGVDLDQEVYEVVIEPLLFGQYYLAIYRVDDKEGTRQLMAPKVPIRPGGGRDRDGV